VAGWDQATARVEVPVVVAPGARASAPGREREPQEGDEDGNLRRLEDEPDRLERRRALAGHGDVRDERQRLDPDAHGLRPEAVGGQRDDRAVSLGAGREEPEGDQTAGIRRRRVDEPGSDREVGDRTRGNSTRRPRWKGTIRPTGAVPGRGVVWRLGQWYAVVHISDCGASNDGQG